MFARTSSGVPAASVRALVEHVDPIADVHDQRHVVVDQQDAGAVVVAHARARPRRTPAPPPRAARRPARPSARTTAPSRALARRRAAARRRARATARAGAGAARGCSSSSSSSARRARVARARRRRRAPRPRRSRARRGRRTSGSAGTCARDRHGRRRCGLQPVMSRPSSSTVPEVGPVEPGDQVDERRLAGAVRADQADDLVPVQLDRDLVERLHALERARDGDGPKRSLRGAGFVGGCDRQGRIGEAIVAARRSGRDDRRAARSSERPSRSRCR